MKNNVLIRISVFYIIAIVLSNIFRFNLFGFEEKMDAFPVWIAFVIKALSEGSGVFIGAIIAIHLLKKKRNTSISLFGTSKIKSLIMIAVPVSLLILTGVENSNEINSNCFGLIVGASTFFYCFFEEYGWRGYLQEELAEITSWKRYLIIGSLWYLWHLSFLNTTSVIQNLFFLVILIFASWGIGQIVIKTKSIIASACFHMIINIMMFNSVTKNGLTLSLMFIILSVTIAIWIFLLIKWDNNMANTAINTQYCKKR